MTPFDLPLLGQQTRDEDKNLLNSSTESIQKLEGDQMSGGGQTGLRVLTVSVFDGLVSECVDPMESGLPANICEVLRQRCRQLGDQRLLCGLSCAQLTALLVTGKSTAAGRPHAIILPRDVKLSPSQADCECEGETVCETHSGVLKQAAESRELRVLVDRVNPRPAAGLLRRLLAGCARLEQLSLRLDSCRDLRAWIETGGWPQVRHLTINSHSACFNIHALSQLFPDLRQLTLRREAERRDERCSCRFRADTLFERLDTVELENVCPTATAAIRAYARSLHMLKLKSCSLTSPSAEYLNKCTSDYRSRTFREIIQAVLRRKLITLPNIQIRHLEVADTVVDVALINRNFPCLKSLSIECTELACDTAATGSCSAQLWFPCLESLHIRYNGQETAEPCILRRPLTRLTEYVQSFGSVRMSQLATVCPGLERLSLDPVLLRDAARLPSVTHLTVSWCGGDTLLQMAQSMPSLRAVRVLDPPYLEKRAWAEVEEQLAASQVEVALEW